MYTFVDSVHRLKYGNTDSEDIREQEDEMTEITAMNLVIILKLRVLETITRCFQCVNVD